MSVNVNALPAVTELNASDKIPAVIGASNEGRTITMANLGAQAANNYTAAGFRTVLPTGTDLDDATNAGIYTLSGNNNYTNLPPGITYGLLTVTKSSAGGGYILQKVITTNARTFARMNMGSTFTSWYEEVRDTGPTRESFSFRGLTIVAVRNGGCVQISISGSLTAAMATASDYVQICTLSEGFRKAAYGFGVWYIFYNSNTYGQIKVETNGNVSLGYSRGIDGASKDLASGTAVYCAATFPGGTSA